MGPCAVAGGSVQLWGAGQFSTARRHCSCGAPGPGLSVYRAWRPGNWLLMLPLPPFAPSGTWTRPRGMRSTGGPCWLLGAERLLPGLQIEALPELPCWHIPAASRSPLARAAGLQAAIACTQPTLVPPHAAGTMARRALSGSTPPRRCACTAPSPSPTPPRRSSPRRTSPTSSSGLPHRPRWLPV